MKTREAVSVDQKKVNCMQKEIRCGRQNFDLSLSKMMHNQDENTVPGINQSSFNVPMSFYPETKKTKYRNY